MLSHQIAVNAYLICKNRFLLLLRTRSPLIWSPPGGHLKPNEDPVRGLEREVLEETGLPIEVVQPVTTWFGKFREDPLLSIDYLCFTDQQSVRLSAEHSKHGWFLIEDLYTKRTDFFASEKGFQFSDFLRAHILNLCLQGDWPQIQQTLLNNSFRKYLPIQKRSRPAD